MKIEIGGRTQQDLTARADAEKAILEKKGYPINAIDYLKYLIQHKLLPANAPTVEFSAAEQVGPTIGQYLQNNALYLVGIALLLITIYVAFPSVVRLVGARGRCAAHDSRLFD